MYVLGGGLAVVKTMAPILLGGFDQNENNGSFESPGRGWGFLVVVVALWYGTKSSTTIISLSACDLVFAMNENAVR